MNKPHTIRDSEYAGIYRAVLNANIGEVLSFGKLSPLDIKTITGNLRNRVYRGGYGEGVRVRIRTQVMTNGTGYKSRVLYIEKYQGETK